MFEEESRDRNTDPELEIKEIISREIMLDDCETDEPLDQRNSRRTTI